MYNCHVYKWENAYMKYLLYAWKILWNFLCIYLGEGKGGFTNACIVKGTHSLNASLYPELKYPDCLLFGLISQIWQSCFLITVKHLLFAWPYFREAITHYLFTRPYFRDLRNLLPKSLDNELLARTLFSRLYALANLRENKTLANEKCFTVIICLEI